MRLPGFIGGSDTGQSLQASCMRTVNWYPEILSRDAKNQAALLPTPGQSPLLMVADVGTRALFTMNGRTHAVIGATPYELFPGTLTATSRGTMTQDTNPAQITSNGAAGGVLAIATGGHLYYLNLSTNVVSQVSGVAALQVGMLDGYFIAFDPIAAKIRLSPLNDTSGTWDPTMFAQRSIAPDPWKAMVAADRLGTRELWLIGEQTGEVWYDAGTLSFPLAPIPGAIFKYGTPAPFSLAVAGPLVIWLSQTSDGAGQVVAARGYTPQVISTRSIESAIASYATITDAEALTLQIEGHTWYVLKFPSANATWVYDITTQQWFELLTWNPSLNRYDAWHPRVHTYANGLHLVGESGTGTISTLDVTVGTEADGSAIRRLRRAPGIFDEGRQQVYRRLQLELNTGLGVTTGQGQTPTVMLRSSNDGGETWGSERQASAGRIGAFGTRVFWTRLGTSRNRAFEVTVSDPVPFQLIDAYVNNDAPNQAG